MNSVREGHRLASHSASEDPRLASYIASQDPHLASHSASEDHRLASHSASEDPRLASHSASEGRHFSSHVASEALIVPRTATVILRIAILCRNILSLRDLESSSRLSRPTISCPRPHYDYFVFHGTVDISSAVRYLPLLYYCLCDLRHTC